MAFNNFPYTNFQDLNLGWILAKIKEALASAATAIAKSEAVESEVGTYSERLSDAENNASEALETANNISDTAENAVTIATRAEATANAINGTAQTALNVANQANATANSIKQTCELIVSGNTVTYNGVVQTGASIHQLFTDGKYPYCVYDDGNGTTYVYKPDIYAVLSTIYTQSFTCITPASAAGEDYELLKRLVLINGVPQFATDIELASTDYVDSQSGLPSVTTTDNGKFLRVVSGSWAAATVPDAESTEFGP